VQLYNYHWEIKDLLTQFLQAFDGAIVKRFDNQRNPGAAIAVRYVYSPKQRVLFDIVDKAQTLTLPVVAFSISSISRDVNRVFNKLDGYYYNVKSTDTASVHTLQPVPVNIAVNISIIAKFQTDMDQILSNFVPWSDPYFVISVTNETMPNTEIRNEVLWDGNLKMTYPTDIQSNDRYRLTCDTTFTIKGWLFKSEVGPVGRVFKVDSNFYAVSAIPENESAYGSIYNALNYTIDTPYNETVTVSARPYINFTDRWITPTSLSGSCTLLGDMYNYTNGVYLSGSVPGMFGYTNITTLSSFSTVPSLSAKYPTLYGLVPALNYWIISNNKMVVNYQAPADAANGGFFDIVVVNDAGYSILSKDTYQSNYSVQPPYALSGIQVVTVNPIEINWQNATFTWDGNTYTWLTV
jgi:T4-like virus Myoviridae tail sheath stabiliser